MKTKSKSKSGIRTSTTARHVLIALVIGCVLAGLTYGVRRQTIDTGTVVCPNNYCPKIYSDTRGWPFEYAIDPGVYDDASSYYDRYDVKIAGFVGDALMYSALSYGVFVAEFYFARKIRRHE